MEIKFTFLTNTVRMYSWSFIETAQLQGVKNTFVVAWDSCLQLDTDKVRPRQFWKAVRKVYIKIVSIFLRDESALKLTSDTQ